MPGVGSADTGTLDELARDPPLVTPSGGAAVGLHASPPDGEPDADGEPDTEPLGKGEPDTDDEPETDGDGDGGVGEGDTAGFGVGVAVPEIGVSEVASPEALASGSADSWLPTAGNEADASGCDAWESDRAVSSGEISPTLTATESSAPQATQTARLRFEFTADVPCMTTPAPYLTGGWDRGHGRGLRSAPGRTQRQGSGRDAVLAEGPDGSHPGVVHAAGARDAIAHRRRLEIAAPLLRRTGVGEDGAPTWTDIADRTGLTLRAGRAVSERHARCPLAFGRRE